MRIIQNKPSVVDINLPNYSYEFCPAESSAGGTLLYVRHHLSYKLRKTLSIYKSYELELNFIKISNLRNANIAVGCIYKYPEINPNEFNELYRNHLLDKLSK